MLACVRLRVCACLCAFFDEAYSRVTLCHAVLCCAQLIVPAHCCHSSVVLVYTINSHQAPGYSNIIRTPMDISTMRRKVEGGQYATWNELAVRLLLLVCAAARGGCLFAGSQPASSCVRSCVISPASSPHRSHSPLPHLPPLPNAPPTPPPPSPSQQQADIILMCANAKVYNHPNTRPHKEADVIFKYSMKYVSVVCWDERACAHCVTQNVAATGASSVFRWHKHLTSWVALPW